VQAEYSLSACFYFFTRSFVRGLLIALVMEAVSSSETSVNFYETTSRNIPQDIFTSRPRLSLSFARGVLIALMMEAVSTSETSVNFCETTSRNIPQDSHLHLMASSISVYRVFHHIV
jgi:hypothetical protein